MDGTVQEAIQDLITALIRSLGSNHGKLLTIMRQCPEGAESLALRVVTIFTEHGRPSAQLVALIKGLITERNLDARFLIPIIAEMDKVKFLPVFVIYASVDFFYSKTSSNSCRVLCRRSMARWSARILSVKCLHR